MLFGAPCLWAFSAAASAQRIEKDLKKGIERHRAVTPA